MHNSSIYYYGATVGDIENSLIINLDSEIRNQKNIRIKEFLYDKVKRIFHKARIPSLKERYLNKLMSLLKEVDDLSILMLQLV